MLLKFFEVLWRKCIPVVEYINLSCHNFFFCFCCLMAEPCGVKQGRTASLTFFSLHILYEHTYLLLIILMHNSSYHKPISTAGIKRTDISVILSNILKYSSLKFTLTSYFCLSEIFLSLNFLFPLRLVSPQLRVLETLIAFLVLQALLCGRPDVIECCCISKGRNWFKTLCLHVTLRKQDRPEAKKEGCFLYWFKNEK